MVLFKTCFSFVPRALPSHVVTSERSQNINRRFITALCLLGIVTQGICMANAIVIGMFFHFIQVLASHYDVII